MSRIGKKPVDIPANVKVENTIVGHYTYIGSLTAIEGDTKIGSYVGMRHRVPSRLSKNTG